MPTPSPIIAAMAVVKSGMVATFDASATSAMPESRPASAVPMGRPMARTEPKAISRMMTAAEDAEGLRRRHLERVEDVAAVLDPHVAGGDVVAELLDRVARLDELLEGAILEVQRGVPDGAVLADLVCALLGVRRGDARRRRARPPRRRTA